MDHVNQTLFALVNGPAHPSPAMLFLARFLAGWLLYLVIAGLAVGWLRSGGQNRRALVHVVLATALSLAVNLAIGAIWYHPRPFELGIGHQLIAHGPETSFPSDHGTILFAAAFALFSYVGARLWSWLALVAALAVAWARVWLGIHWPFDMFGSALVALGGVWVVASARKTRWLGWATDFILALIDGLLDIARVPVAWVRRTGTDA